MPVQLNIYERRDNGDREAMGNSALQMTRIAKAREGIQSSRFYWHRVDTVVMISEGKAEALSSPGTAAPADFARAGFDMADNARETLNWRLSDPRASEETYRAAGR